MPQRRRRKVATVQRGDAAEVIERDETTTREGQLLDLREPQFLSIVKLLLNSMTMGHFTICAQPQDSKTVWEPRYNCCWCSSNGIFPIPTGVWTFYSNSCVKVFVGGFTNRTVKMPIDTSPTTGW